MSICTLHLDAQRTPVVRPKGRDLEVTSVCNDDSSWNLSKSNSHKKRRKWKRSSKKHAYANNIFHSDSSKPSSVYTLFASCTWGFIAAGNGWEVWLHNVESVRKVLKNKYGVNEGWLSSEKKKLSENSPSQSDPRLGQCILQALYPNPPKHAGSSVQMLNCHSRALSCCTWR